MRRNCTGAVLISANSYDAEGAQLALIALCVQDDVSGRCSYKQSQLPKSL
jgi:hypothetical protein